MTDDLTMTRVGPEANPFTARAGKKRKDKIAYCTRHIYLMAKWFAETGDRLFKREAELWHKRIEAVKENKL